MDQMRHLHRTAHVSSKTILRNTMNCVENFGIRNDDSDPKHEVACMECMKGLDIDQSRKSIAEEISDI